MTEPARRWTFEAGAEVARARAWEKCEVRTFGCQGRDSQTHHRQARGMGGVSGEGMSVNRPSCLLRVCLNCHNTIESRREWARRRGLLVHRPADPGAVPVYLNSVNGTGWFVLTDEGMYVWQDLPEDYSAIASLAA